jgi:glycosyltransferase involved in cell wall biosynthesis
MRALASPYADRSIAEPIRVLYVQPAELFGGAERQGVLHMKLLTQHGFDVIPFVGPGQQIRRELATVGVADYVFVPRMVQEPNAPLDGIWRTLAWIIRFAGDFIATQRALFRVLRQRRVQLIVANRSTGWIASAFAARVLRIPIVWRGGSRITQRAETIALRLLSSFFAPNLLLANCEPVRDDLGQALHCPTDILPNGVDTQRFDPANVSLSFRREHDIDPATPVVGLLARPAPGKGLELLARVVDIVSRARPSVRFLIAGEFGWRAHYEQLFAAAGLRERVRFLGHVDDVAGFLRACDLVVLTSSSRSIEGSPNALLEAMAMERPIVATRVGGIAEAITHGVQGFLVEEDAAASFAARVGQLLADETLRRRMGVAGRVRIMARFHHERVVAGLAHTLRSLVAPRVVPVATWHEPSRGTSTPLG